VPLPVALVDSEVEDVNVNDDDDDDDDEEEELIFFLSK